ncbi:MAG TPA: ATP-binding protein, partial [Pilimelia sp.]|nr:ATP-binding protein [Pilimelia sp.]
SALQYRTVHALTERVNPLRLANLQVRTQLSDAQRSLRGYLLTGDPQFLSSYESARREYVDGVAALRTMVDTEADRDLFEQQVTLADAWWAHAQRQRRVPARSDAAGLAAAAGSPLADRAMEVNQQLDRRLEARAEALRDRSRRLGVITVLTLVGCTLGVAALAAAAAVHATRRITRPLRRVVTVLEQLGQGERARAPADFGPAEVRAVARALNSMADDVEAGRAAEREAARLAARARELGVRVRHHLSVDAAIEEAAAGLGEMLDADHVVIRVLGRDDGKPPVARWSRDGAPGSTDALAALRVAWTAGERGPTWISADVRNDASSVPPEERAALLVARARAALTAGFDGGPGARGAVTLIRCGEPAAAADAETGDQPRAWSALQVRAAESVAADLGRGLLQAQLFEREQELVARLRDLDNAKSDFMSTVSHELRTPLTSIAGYVEMLRDGDAGEVTPGQVRMLDVIDRNTNRLRALIEDLLVLSRIEAGTFKINRTQVDFSWLVNSAVAAIGPVASASGVALDTDIGGGLTGQADPEQLDRVLMNLLSNAVKFTPRGGRVVVLAHRVGDEIVLRVTDTGIGIPTADLDRLFTRFFRAGNASERAIPGTGLGLAIVRTIVVNHGGRVSVSSREGTGTTFTVRLPG